MGCVAEELRGCIGQQVQHVSRVCTGHRSSGVLLALHEPQWFWVALADRAAVMYPACVTALFGKGAFAFTHIQTVCCSASSENGSGTIA